MAADEAVVFAIAADASQFKRVMASLEGETKAAASSMDRSMTDALDAAAGAFGRAGTAISIGVTAPLAAIGVMAGKTAIDFTKLYESTMVVFRSMLGGDEAAQALYSSLLDIAKGSTFAQETFLAAGKKLVGMGVDAETTTAILQATTDAVAGFGGSAQNIEQVTDAFAKMSNSGRLSMEEVNTLSDNGVQALKILANQYGVTTDEMRGMISDGAVPADEAIAKLTDGIENGTDGANGMTQAMAGMAESMKGGTLTGAFDGINTAIRTFSLSLVGINPTLKETDKGYEESEKRIRQLTAAVTTISEIIPLLAKVFSGVTDAVGRVLDALIGTNVHLDESTKKWTNVGGALGEFKRYLRDTPTDKLALIGNLLVAIAVTGPALKIVSVAVGALNVAITAGRTLTATAAAAHTVYNMALQTGTRASALATAATAALNTVMAANPAVLVVAGIAALAIALGALAIASSAAKAKSEELTVASQAQKDEVDRLRAEYDDLCASQGEHSDAAVEAKARLDDETAAFEASKQTVDEFVAGLEDSSAAHKQLMDDLDAAGQAADEEAGSILALLAQFDELAAKENRSEEDKVRLKAVTDELNASVDGLNISYDVGTDRLSATAEAVDAVCRAEADRLRYAQKMEEIPQLLVDEAEQSEALARTKEELAAAQGRLDEAYGDSTGEIRKTAEATGELRINLSDCSDGMADAQDTVRTLTGQLGTQEQELQETRDRLRESEQAAARFATEQSALAAATSAVASGMDEASAAALYGVDAAELAAKVASDEAVAQEELAQKLNETEQAITDYIGAHPAVRDALSDSGLSVSEFSDLLVAQGVEFDEAAKQIEDYSARAAAGFDKVADSSENTLGKLYETLAYNLEATENWSDNLQAVFGRTGVSFSEEFVDAVKKGGVEEYGTAMAQMRDLSDEELQNISDAYARNGQAGVDSWIAEQQLLVPGTKEALDGTGEAVDEALGEGEAAAAESGATTGAAYSDSLASAIAGCPDEVRTYIAQLEAELASAEGSAAEAGAGTGEGYSAGLRDAISACPAEVQGYIAQIEGKLQELQGPAAEIGAGTGEAYGSGAAEGIGSQAGPVASSATDLLAAVQSAVAPMPLYGLETGTQTGQGFATGLGSQAGATGTAAGRVRGAAEDPLASIDGGSYGSGASADFASGIGRNQQAVSTAASAIKLVSFAMVAEALKAYTYGSHMTSQFAAGMRSQIGQIRSAASAAADAARSILHFSVPDEGPLADADEYGPEFRRLIADGIRSRISEVRAASAEASAAMAAPFDGETARNVAASRALAADLPARPASAAATAVVTNNYYTVERIDASGDPAVRRDVDNLWADVRRHVRTGV